MPRNCKLRTKQDRLSNFLSLNGVQPSTHHLTKEGHKEGVAEEEKGKGGQKKGGQQQHQRQLVQQKVQLTDH